MRFPGGAHAGTVVEALARGVDVLPTLYEALAVAPAGGEQGRSLLGRIEGVDDTPYLLFAQTQTRNAKERRAGVDPEGEAWLEHRVAVSDGRHKLIHDLDADRFQYFDLERDPGERHDRIDDPAAADEVARLRAAYEALEAGLPRAGDTTGALDAEMQAVLDKMGYTGK
jgi:arylsulfatase A-like enzyme